MWYEQETSTALVSYNGRSHHETVHGGIQFHDFQQTSETGDLDTC